MDIERLKAILTLHEGTRKAGDRHIVYDDANGKPIVAGTQVIGNPTVGHGRNLAGRGLSEQTVDQMLEEDIEDVRTACSHLAWFSELNNARQNVILEMAFNLGFDKLMKFKTTLALIASGQYPAAATAMMQSLWAHQVGTRATELATQMNTGEFK